MSKKAKVLKIWVVVTVMLLCVSGCGSNGDLNVADNESSLVGTETENNKVSSKDDPATETAVPGQKENADTNRKSQSNQVVETDLKPSEGFEFESNGDGTCTITGIGTCTDKNIIIPVESPNGDTVTLIGEYALYSLENVDSITLLNCNCEIDKNAFQYGEFTSLSIIGGNPVIKESAFSSCEDWITVNIDCDLVILGEYAFYSCEDLKSVTICENAKSDNEIKIDDRAFQYCKRLETINVGNGNTEIGKTVFFGCAENLIIAVAGENYTSDTIKDGLKEK